MEFDNPIYKVLAHNDTGDAAGHQGGFVLPKALEDYLPLLRNETTSQNPTVGISIKADLFVGSRFLEAVETRYQYQTWGGARSPERRITGGIGNLRNAATKDDILIIERGIEDEARYRFTLIKNDHPKYGDLIKSFGSSRWGILDPKRTPVPETAIDEAVLEIVEARETPFAMFDTEVGHAESRIRRISRGRAFGRLVRDAYCDECAICASGYRHPDGRSELEAGHVVSRSKRGSDDVRNGLLLCRGHHWAFDSGLFGIDDNYQILIAQAAENIAQNASLIEYHGRQIRLPVLVANHPAQEALAWHRVNVMI